MTAWTPTVQRRTAAGGWPQAEEAAGVLRRQPSGQEGKGAQGGGQGEAGQAQQGRQAQEGAGQEGQKRAQKCESGF